MNAERAAELRALIEQLDSRTGDKLARVAAQRMREMCLELAAQEDHIEHLKSGLVGGETLAKAV